MKLSEVDTTPLLDAEFIAARCTPARALEVPRRVSDMAPRAHRSVIPAPPTQVRGSLRAIKLPDGHLLKVQAQKITEGGPLRRRCTRSTRRSSSWASSRRRARCTAASAAACSPSSSESRTSKMSAVALSSRSCRRRPTARSRAHYAAGGAQGGAALRDSDGDHRSRRRDLVALAVPAREGDPVRAAHRPRDPQAADRGRGDRPRRPPLGQPHVDHRRAGRRQDAALAPDAPLAALELVQAPNCRDSPALDARRCSTSRTARRTSTRISSTTSTSTTRRPRLALEAQGEDLSLSYAGAWGEADASRRNKARRARTSSSAEDPRTGMPEGETTPGGRARTDSKGWMKLREVKG